MLSETTISLIQNATDNVHITPTRPSAYTELSPTPTIPAQGMDIVREWADGEIMKRNLEEQLRTLKKEQEEREETVLEYLAQEGITRISIGAGTVHHESKLWASLTGDIDNAHIALKKAGLGDMVRERVNTHTLSAWVREVGEDDIPHSIEPYIKVTRRHHARLRRR